MPGNKLLITYMFLISKSNDFKVSSNQTTECLKNT